MLQAVAMPPGSRSHWQDVYAQKGPAEVSWFEEIPHHSLALIERLGIQPTDSIIDVGGGASNLARELVRRGYGDVTVADLSSTALDHSRAEMGADAARVAWVEADVRDHDFGRAFDLWHDRAFFHFMVDEPDTEGYLATLSRSLRPGGQLIIATFGPKGPTRCSGLPVQRYSAQRLSDRLGNDWVPGLSELHVHITPSGAEQQFQYAVFQRRAAG
jgi:ubiquinone/menaquinone biosynthesis C-methylase UbiE